MEVPVETLYLPHSEEEEEMFFKEYKPPARDAIVLPLYVFYLVIATTLVLGVVYAIVGHLIKDLIHDLADYLFGEQPKEEKVNLFEGRDKFMADWIPETTPELEEMAQAEEVKVVLEGNRQAPVIWVISDGRGPRPPRNGPRVAFWKKV